MVFDKGMNSEDNLALIDSQRQIHFITTYSTHFAEELARLDDEKTERPPLPLHQGHLALMLATGMLSGVVGSGEDRHVVKGKVQKVVVNHTEYNSGAVQERQLDQYQVSIKVLTIEGEIKVLV